MLLVGSREIGRGILVFQIMIRGRVSSPSLAALREWQVYPELVEGTLPE